MPCAGARQGHLPQEFGADLVTKATRPAMDADGDVAARQAEHRGNAVVGDRCHLLYLEIVVARTKRTHLLALAVPRAMRHSFGPGTRNTATLLDPVEILGTAVALPDRPIGTAFEHAIHLALVEHDLACAPHTGRDRPGQTMRQSFLARLQILPFETGQQVPDPAGDVEPDATGRNDPAQIRVEGGNATDREAVAPMRVRHRIGGVDDTRQASHIADLLEDLVVHLGNQALVAVKHGGHAHLTLGIQTPFPIRNTVQSRQVHWFFRLFRHRQYIARPKRRRRER